MIDLSELKNGAKEVELKIKMLSKEKGVSVGEFIWNDGKGINNGAHHCVSVVLNGKPSKLSNIPSDQIEDYPERVGTEYLDAELISLVNRAVR